MAFRDKQRVIYTSPLKALSNQKFRWVGFKESGRNSVVQTAPRTRQIGHIGPNLAASRWWMGCGGRGTGYT